MMGRLAARGLNSMRVRASRGSVIRRHGGRDDAQAGHVGAVLRGGYLGRMGVEPMGVAMKAAAGAALLLMLLAGGWQAWFWVHVFLGWR